MDSLLCISSLGMDIFVSWWQLWIKWLYSGSFMWEMLCRQSWRLRGHWRKSRASGEIAGFFTFSTVAQAFFSPALRNENKLCWSQRPCQLNTPDGSGDTLLYSLSFESGHISTRTTVFFKLVWLRTTLWAAIFQSLFCYFQGHVSICTTISIWVIGSKLLKSTCGD